MKEVNTVTRGGKRLMAAAERYKWVLLVLLAGVLLLMLPSLGGDSPSRGGVGAEAAAGSNFDLGELERKLADTLSQVEGAGQVRVVLTLKTGPRQILAQDVSSSAKEGAVDQSASTVVTSKGSAGQEAVLLQEVYPTFQGALVVCPGGDDPTIRLHMANAVSALTGLGADKISICKGK